jgi:hypothetical protein
LGDYFTILNVIRAYNTKLAELKTQPAELSRDELDNLETELGLDSQLGGGSSSDSIDKWCRSQFISAKKLRMIKIMTKDLSRHVKQLAKKTELEQYEKYDGLVEDDRILGALILGNPVNIAVSNALYGAGGKANTYIPLFPSNKIGCNIAPDSSIKAVGTHAIIYYELFTTVKDAKVVKANVVTKIPDSMLADIKAMIPAKPKSVKPIPAKVTKPAKSKKVTKPAIATPAKSIKVKSKKVTKPAIATPAKVTKAKQKRKRARRTKKGKGKH